MGSWETPSILPFSWICGHSISHYLCLSGRFKYQHQPHDIKTSGVKVSSFENKCHRFAPAFICQLGNQSSGDSTDLTYHLHGPGDTKQCWRPVRTTPGLPFKSSLGLVPWGMPSTEHSPHSPCPSTALCSLLCILQKAQHLLESMAVKYRNEK